MGMYSMGSIGHFGTTTEREPYVQFSVLYSSYQLGTFLIDLRLLLSLNTPQNAAKITVYWSVGTVWAVSGTLDWDKFNTMHLYKYYNVNFEKELDWYLP